MKTQTVIILWVSGAFCLGCLICGGGLVASYLTSQLIAQKNKKVMLVVAKRDYPKGTEISDPEQMFELREFFDKDAPQAAVVDFDEGSKGLIRGSILMNDIHEGQPLQLIFLERPALKKLREDVNLHLKLDPPGPGKQHFRMIAKGREQFIKAGSRVDVIQKQSQEDPKAEKILLHSALIRSATPRSAILQKMQQKEEKKDSLPQYLVTLEITDEEAKVLQSAMEASLKEHEIPIFELRPGRDAKKVDEKKSSKAP
jgi:Flp pilus assembly protein CpaB